MFFYQQNGTKLKGMSWKENGKLFEGLIRKYNRTLLILFGSYTVEKWNQTSTLFRD